MTNFSVTIEHNDIFPVIVLKDKVKKTEAVIYSFGGLLNSFTINGKQNIIEGYNSCDDAKKNITNGFKSCKLSPFVCRIKNGLYSFQNKTYSVNKFFIKEEAIHGLLYDAMFSITSLNATENAAFVTLEYSYTKKDEGFPFTYSCAITYRLEKENKLVITTNIINQSQEELPLCDGWHPYFTFDQPVDDILLKINSNNILEFDDKLLPTRKILTFNNFQTPEKLNETVFDNCFLIKNTTNLACSLTDKNNKLKLNILPSESYPYLQVYTPPHRNSIAIENLSAAPDAFNNNMGLLILKPGERKIFETAFQAIYY